MNDLQRRVDDARLRSIEFEQEYETVTVPQMLSKAARLYGSNIAVDFFDRKETLTYEELQAGSDRYANALRAFGLRKGDRIAVMLPNRREFPLIWFACAKLGTIFVPLNMRYTSREIAFVLNDTKASAAIVDATVWQTFAEMDTWPQDLERDRVIVVGEAPAAGVSTLVQVLEGASSLPIAVDVQPDDVVSIQYTSGTTGFPKGCILTNDYWGIVSAVQAYRLLAPYQHHLCWAPLTYADGMIHMVSAIRHGATVHMPERLSSTRFIAWLKAYQIEWCSIPELIARQPATSFDHGVRLKQYQFGGGTWNPSSVANFRQRFPVCGNGFYGLTETGYATLPPNDTNEMAEIGSSGLCAPFRETRLVDDDGKPVMVGQVGELWVRGKGMFKGYWNRPDANAELFNDGWFKTGDLLRCDEFGFHYFMGRKKDMIRRSNENIAAREVEAVVCEIPEIAAAAVVAVPDAERGEEVKVWVELKHGINREAVPVQRILDHARSRLAAFKVPRYVTYSDVLPRVVSNPNKINKRELTDVENPLANTYDSNVGHWL
ncbi:class I adenylate-forming enzyme family protein [Burkholderia sp. BCC1977]|uniref:class I adenylate-forming enzyme family protein n=1 Tax=Burkholderia sp. BCC1977 TaxID=2817440 RepID=UPI002ABE152C|nr:class I adenylate-forming enzyme family protein [Burkholderia sp. BCC1977]